jgi:hypothetical protein
MQLSAEIRLFWFDMKPAALEKWFMDAAIHRLTPWGPEVRTDVYLADGDQLELGVKTRGENPGVEVKGLIATVGDKLEFDSYQIPIELWSKWPSQKLGFETKASMTLHKQRWLRKFDTAGPPVEARDARPEIGCNVEWTIVQPPSAKAFWTLGFESFGRLSDIENSLRTVARVMQERTPPPAPGAEILSYPACIRRLRQVRAAERGSALTAPSSPE